VCKSVGDRGAPVVINFTHKSIKIRYRKRAKLTCKCRLRPALKLPRQPKSAQRKGALACRRK